MHALDSLAIPFCLHSDSQTVIFEIREHRRAQNPKLAVPKLKKSFFDKGTFHLMMNSMSINQRSIENLFKQLILAVVEVSDAAIPRTVPNRKRSPCYW